MRTCRLRTGPSRTGCPPRVVVYWPHRAPCPWIPLHPVAVPRRRGHRPQACRPPPPTGPGTTCTSHRGRDANRYWPVGVARWLLGKPPTVKDSLKVRGTGLTLSTTRRNQSPRVRRVAPACFPGTCPVCGGVNTDALVGCTQYLISAGRRRRRDARRRGDRRVRGRSHGRPRRRRIAAAPIHPRGPGEAR